jgi:hypothetical protein
MIRMVEKGPLNGTKKKLTVIKYKIRVLQTDIRELDKIRKEEEHKLLGELGPENEDYVLVMDEAKRDGKLIGVSKEEEREDEQKTVYSTSKELRSILGNLEYELSYTEDAWYSSSNEKKKVKKHREMKNDE